ncbi:MAG: CPBP family intramembrane metalloprotease [Clostridia bacterium]|nr:CPBP family intramembrane metalloprotease [Clostridia bacterium]
MENKTHKRFFGRPFAITSVAVLGAMILLYEVLNISLTDNEILSPIVNMTVTRTLGALVFAICVLHLGYRVMDPLRKPIGKSLLFILPCLAVVINNFPIISAIRGDAYLDSPWYYVLIYAAQCIAVATFEELAFRGVVFLYLLEKRRKTVRGVFIAIVITSAVFGLIHLLNLLEGSSPIPVLMQIGYSFLIGGMCSVVLVKTANIWLCVLLHAIFNFCGQLMPTLGKGTWWDTPTIVITVLLAVAVTVYIVLSLFKITPQETDRLFKTENTPII